MSTLSIQGMTYDHPTGTTYLQNNQLEGEAVLNPSVMGACDGNNSLGRFIKGRRQADTLTFESDYFLTHEFVDKYKDKVKRRVWKPDSQEVSLTHLACINT